MFVPTANALMQLLLIGEIVNNAAKQQLMTWRDKEKIYTSESRRRISRIASVFVMGSAKRAFTDEYLNYSNYKHK
jgi:hypothetical protein